MRVKKYTISNFICNECGAVIPLPRPTSLRREKNHQKDLYCYKCKKIVKTTEVKNEKYM